MQPSRLTSAADLEVPDEPVILDERHQSSSRKVAYGRKRFDAARLNVRRYSSAVRSSSDERVCLPNVVQPLADRVDDQLVVPEELLGVVA